ncbi:hypothetical protein [Vibrio sinus]
MTPLGKTLKPTLDSLALWMVEQKNELMNAHE